MTKIGTGWPSNETGKVVEGPVFQTLSDGELMGWFRDRRVICSSWERGLAARLQHEDGRWRPWAPNWDLLDADGEAAEAGAEDFIEAIPARIRRLAGACPRRQWLALDAARHVDGFAAFLEQETAAAGLGFVLLCWEVSHAQYRPSAERHGLARAIITEKRARLLTRLTDVAFTDMHVRRLAKVDIQAVDKDLVWDLVDTAADPVVAQALADAPRIGAALLRVVATLPPWLRVPALLRLMAQGRISPVNTEAALKPLLEADTHLRPRIRTSLATVTGWDDFVGLVERWRQTIRAAIAFPPPPIPGSARLTFIRDGLELEEEGKVLNHCVANYTERALKGECAFYRWLGEERATVQLERRPDGWQVVQHLGHGNRRLSAASAAAIRQEVAAQWAGRPAPAPWPLDTYVAGAAYTQAAAVFDRLRPGQRLLLRREPANAHDPLAVEVLTEAGDKLGYVPRVHNRLPAARLDAGEPLEAWVTTARPPLDIRIRLGARLRAVA